MRTLRLAGPVAGLCGLIAAPLYAQSVQVPPLSFQGLPVAPTEIKVTTLSFEGLPLPAPTAVDIPTLSFRGLPPEPNEVTVSPLSFHGLPPAAPTEVDVSPLSFQGLPITPTEMTVSALSFQGLPVPSTDVTVSTLSFQGLPMTPAEVTVGPLSFQGLPITPTEMTVSTLSFQGLPIASTGVTVSTLSFHGLPLTPAEVTVSPLSFHGLPPVAPMEVDVSALSFQGLPPADPAVSGQLSFAALGAMAAAVSSDGRVAVSLRSRRLGGTPNLRQLDALVAVRATGGDYVSTRDGAVLTVEVDEGPGRGWRASLPVRVPTIAADTTVQVAIPFTLRGTGVVAPGSWPSEPGVNPSTYYRFVLVRVTLATGDAGSPQPLGPFCYDAASGSISQSGGCGGSPAQ
ncbi:MAG: hypothetical protein AB7P67_04235 [Vicinamibacterales bacterium]